MTRFSALVATLFFTCLSLDGAAFNRVENEVAALVAKLPPGQCVVAGISDSGARLNALLQVVDRTCRERCFSYGNCQPATGPFRIRVPDRDRVIAATMGAVQEPRGTIEIIERVRVFAVHPARGQASRPPKGPLGY